MKQFDMGDETAPSEYGGMTHYVDLPTKGEYYPEEHPLHGVDKIEIKMMTTKEEDVLTNQSYIESGVVIDKLLESIIILNVSAQDIFEPDKMAILIASRIEAYGEDYGITMLCEKCGEINNYNVDLLEIQQKIIESKLEITEYGTVIVELPKSKKVIEFKHLLPRTTASIEKTVQKMKKLNINTNFNTEFFKRIVVSVDGDTNKEEVAKLVENLRILDSRVLSLAYTRSLPSLDTSFKATCSSCAHESEGGLPIQANFFFPEF
tara:strand:+ start:362 stop:1150 length:789 start_codon:yes stop_codon:yes gene_type:complete